VEPIVECLEKHGIANYWYDRRHIGTGHAIIQRINEGLSKSKIGMIIFSRSYLQKHWTTWELFVIVTLLITHKIRIIPFLHSDITYDQVTEKYPILVPLRFDKIPSCDELIPLVKRQLKETGKLMDNPVSFVSSDIVTNGSRYELPSNKDEDKSRSETIEVRIDENRLLESYQDLQEVKNPETTGIAIIIITKYSRLENFWNLKVSWKIIDLFLSSSDSNFRKHGIDILTEMLKKSRDKLGVNNHVIKNANELFAHKLLESIKPESSKTITADLLNVLEMILDYDNLFSICLWSLIDGVKRLSNNQYTGYPEIFISKLNKGSVEQKNIVCENMRNVARTSGEQIVRERARNLFKEFFRDPNL
jgi:hypothetical protein